MHVKELFEYDDGDDMLYIVLQRASNPTGKFSSQLAHTFFTTFEECQIMHLEHVFLLRHAVLKMFVQNVTRADVDVQ